ncbi:MAG: YkvA family protein [Bdellovibrionota bacterium]
MDSEDLKNDKKLKDKLYEAGSKPGAEEKVKKHFFQYFKKNKHTIGFGQQIEKIYDLLTSGKLNNKDKAIIIGALLYFINPFDLLPDITPLLGFIDDMGVIGLVYRYLTNRSFDVTGEPTPEDDTKKDDKKDS